jgi:predicted amidophosphoribosyltransferase
MVKCPHCKTVLDRQPGLGREACPECHYLFFYGHLKCPNCGYKWLSKTTHEWITCPNCMRKFRIFKKGTYDKIRDEVLPSSVGVHLL